MARMRLPAESSKKQLRVGRPATMRCAFIVCASDDGDLAPEAELTGRIDVLRRYFDLALPRASRGLLHADTTL